MLSNRHCAQEETSACKGTSRGKSYTTNFADVDWLLPFFIFPDNFTHSILIVKNIPPGGQGSGATAHPKEEAKISELTLFHAAPATKRLDPEVQ